MTRTILAVQGAPNATIQNLMREAARHWAEDGARVVGVVEIVGCGGSRRALQDLSTGKRYELDQDLGPGSTACKLVGSGIAEASEDLCCQIRFGCDLVVLSKFGKLEAERSGLVAAFAAAVEANKPILTAVSPALAPQWARFAGHMSAFAPASFIALETWWGHVRPGPPSGLGDAFSTASVEEETGMRRPRALS